MNAGVATKRRVSPLTYQRWLVAEKTRIIALHEMNT